MALLTQAKKYEVLRDFVLSNTENISIVKQQIIAAIEGMDGYYETNQAAMNLDIPQPARASLSTSQKSLLYALVSRKRYG